MIQSSGVAYPKILGIKMFNFRRITLFCLEKRLSKHKWLYFLKILGGMAPLVPLATPITQGKYFMIVFSVVRRGDTNLSIGGFELLAVLNCLYIGSTCSTTLNNIVEAVASNFKELHTNPMNAQTRF